MRDDAARKFKSRLGHGSKVFLDKAGRLHVHCTMCIIEPGRAGSPRVVGVWGPDEFFGYRVAWEAHVNTPRHQELAQHGVREYSARDIAAIRSGKFQVPSGLRWVAYGAPLEFAEPR